MIKDNLILKLVCILVLISFSSCAEGLETEYKFDNGKGIVAEVMSSSFNYYLIFKDNNNKIIFKRKVGIGRMDSGVSSAMWDNSKNNFALKICGEEESVYIYTYDLSKDLFKEYINPKQNEIPDWIKFSVKAGFDLPEDIKID